ncbi:MAG: DUF1670 domain-containing protein [Syntrophobacteria bacterium]
MPMIPGAEVTQRSRFERVSRKTLDHLFLSQVENGAKCPPFVSNAILEVAKRVFNLESSQKDQNLFKPGQYRVIGVWSSEPAGKAIKDCRKGQCTITLDAGQDDRQIRNKHGLVALRRARLLRICSEACEQGILLSQEDIAFSILNCSLRTVVRDVEHWRKKGIAVPTRGQQKDIGPGLSHKVAAVKLLLDRVHPLDIAHRLYHSLAAIERYTQCFARVVVLHKQGMSSLEIAFVVQIWESLVKQYLNLYQQYSGAEYQQRLNEIIGKAKGIPSPTPVEHSKKVRGENT